MPQEPTVIEQAVSRAIRDNLERIQRTTDELNQAVNDVVAACASSKPANALPPMLRAQATAASVAAALEVLSRFVAVTLQPAHRSPLEAEMTRLAGTVTAESAPPVEAAREAELREAMLRETTTAVSLATSQPVVEQHAKTGPAVEPHPAAHQSTEIPPHVSAETFTTPEPLDLPQPGPFPEDVEVAAEPGFDVHRLSAEEQELHRRANRVAKVSMQDIKMLRPEQVRLGREKKDLCVRLRDDIEKAHREYDRRFRPIMDHPVDYFYRWMVEILADGDAHALGEYPYALHANQR
ncbi:MAG: hypothetical protein ABLQ96_04245 [Candidatus Acidiferrum sp.]